MVLSVSSTVLASWLRMCSVNARTGSMKLYQHCILHVCGSQAADILLLVLLPHSGLSCSSRTTSLVPALLGPQSPTRSSLAAPSQSPWQPTQQHLTSCPLSCQTQAQPHTPQTTLTAPCSWPLPRRAVRPSQLLPQPTSTLHSQDSTCCLRSQGMTHLQLASG